MHLGYSLGGSGGRRFSAQHNQAGMDLRIFTGSSISNFRGLRFCSSANSGSRVPNPISNNAFSRAH